MAVAYARRTIADVRFGSKADIGAGRRDVRFTPESGHQLSALGCPLCATSRHSALRQRLVLFDDLVGGGQQRRWHVEIECFGGFAINDKVEFGWSLHR